jgi:hypothetical protein
MSTRGGARGGNRNSSVGGRGVTGIISAQAPSDRTTASSHGGSGGEDSKLRQKYKSQLSTAKELFPDWADDDLLATFTEYNGDLEQAILAISEGEQRTHARTDTQGANDDDTQSILATC